MSYQFRLPDVGEGITESDLLKWHVKVGDLVREDDLLCEIETDKAVVEIPVPCSGTLVGLHAEEGATVAVGSIIATFETNPDRVDEPVQQEISPVINNRAASTPVVTESVTDATTRATPSTRKYAREMGVELNQVTGSGPKGRILRSDIDRQFSATGEPQVGMALKVSPTNIPLTGGQRRTPLKGLRKAIAETMVRSVTIIPHATSGFSCNAERFVALRQQLQLQLGCRISYTAMVMKALIPGIRRYPFFNASIDDAKNEIVEHGDINIGFATHTDAGLMVPVIKQVDRLSLLEISNQIDRLAGLARQRKIDLADLKGGTITLSNVGSHGKHDRAGRPIVNHPEAAIIAMARIKPMPAVVGDQVVPQQTLDLVTSYDHRIIDGVYAALFMETLIGIVEEPGMLLAY